MENFPFGTWPWYVAGPLIGLTVPLMLLLTNKALGISSSFRHVCAIALPRSKAKYLRDHDWRAEIWNLVFVAGLVIGGFVAAYLLSAQRPQLLPDHYYSVKGYLQLLAGGVLVGFGTRYAGGCTSGHTIFGLSTLQSVSLYATLSFFAGGLTAALIAMLFF